MENTNFNSQEICYTSEAGDNYSYADFLETAKGNEKLARIIKDLCTWQCPETVFQDLLMEEEITEDGHIIEQE